MDDVNEYDPLFYVTIQQNARRYHMLFGDAPVRDALDAFIFQLVYLDRKQNEDGSGADQIQDLRKKYPPQLLRRFEVFFKGSSISKPLAIREVKAAHVGKLIVISGIVIRSTEVKPMASVMTYTCDTCGYETYQPIAGPTFIPPLNCPSKVCVENRANGRLQMQIRGSKFMKFQEMRIQELNEQVPVGSIPRSLTVNVIGENARACVPGDFVRTTLYILRYFEFMKWCAEYVSVEKLRARYPCEQYELTDEEVEIVSQDNFYELLAYSIAPEIYGHLDVKKSLLLALEGGVDKNVNGMKVRGCINILLMSDPGVAKSQLLSYVDRLTIRSQYTTGRGSFGVGLMAAVMKDPATGEMTLEGGALVLADQGICCIDEFDKMMDADRTAIHEVTEQQTAKAGILTTLNARVSIIAAANPAFGRYNPKKSIEHNVDLPAALLSRFDLLWLIQDRPDRESDKRLAEHITYVHMKGLEPEREGMKPLDMSLIRRYIALCKRKQPVIEEKLRDRLVDMYVDLRKDARNNRNSVFTSPRSLLAVIRLSSALARLRLSDVVQSSDIDEASGGRIWDFTCLSSVTTEQLKQHEIPILDQAFAVIRDLYHSISDDENRSLPLQRVFEKCFAKGISEEVVQECINTYTANGVLMVDRQQRIVFTVA
uniref:DNA replication licensing factor MCM7 n=1 Tax=Brugia malayi TaxID=6279 RepID=A0A1I9G0Q3_BRUMA|nr:Bm9143 [Brugia malayi]